MRTFATIVFVAFLACNSASGLTKTKHLGHLKVTVYAPDWIWQKNAVNILIVLENEGSQPVDCSLDFLLPESLSDHFTYDADLIENKTIHVPALSTIRHAYTNIEALGNVELQTYPFQFRLASGRRSAIIEYPLTTIRGPLVNSAQWALYLPAMICLGCCMLFVLAGMKFSQRGAWKTSSEPIPEPDDLEDWINPTS